MSKAPFTREERDLSMGDAMHEPALRIRILQHVAQTKGISTAAAQRLIEGRVRNELSLETSLGQVLDHMDHPNFQPTTLDTPIGVVFGDSKTLHRLAHAVAMDQGINYAKALEQLHDATDEAHSRGKRTLGDALDWSRSKPEDVQANMTLLERRDAAVGAAQERALRPVMLERTDDRGLVLLDQGDSARPGTDIGTALTDPAERERRLARARKAAPGMYDGDKGRQEFNDFDRRYLEVGLDLVRTMERGNEIRAAQNEAAQVARQLDQVIASTVDRRQQLRLLDAEIERLQGQRSSVRSEVLQRESTLRVLESRSKGAEREHGGLAFTDGAKLLSTTLQKRLIEERAARPDESYDDARRRVIAEAEPGVPITLEQEFDIEA